MKIFEALYNPCIHESGWVTLSLHRTREGAEKAIDADRNEEKEKFDLMVAENPEDWKGMKFDDHLDWTVGEKELLD